MLIPFVVPISVEAFLDCRGRVFVARPSHCPACGHARVTFAGWWTRLTRRGPVDIHRVACAHCGATHSLWPDVLVAGCGDLVDIVGGVLADAASGAGHRAVAAGAGLAASTVRGWLRRFDRVATRTVNYFLALTASAAPGALPVGMPGRPKAAAVVAVIAAAASVSRRCEQRLDPWRLAVMHTRGRLLG